MNIVVIGLALAVLFVIVGVAVVVGIVLLVARSKNDKT